MALGKQRTICAAILGLALVALGVDRFVLGGGSPGESPSDLLVASKETVARVAEAAGSLLGARSEPAPSVSKEAAVVADLANTLRQLGVDRAVLDGLPESFAVALPKPVEAVVAAPVRAPIGEPPLVSAVLLGASPRILAAGKSFGLGAEIDGWTVVHVAKGRVVFERDGRSAERTVGRVPDPSMMVLTSQPADD